MRRFFLFLLLLVSQIFAGCATVGPPVTSAEVAQRRAELQAKAQVYRGAQLKQIEAIARRLISFMPSEEQAKLGNLRYELSDKADIDAYATWNKVGVSYGMLRFSESEDELAMVIAHELAHLTRGHLGKTLATNVLSTTLGAAAQVAIDSIGGYGVGSAVGQAIGSGVAGAFSRDFEREADYYASQYAFVAGFNVPKGIGVWDRFAIEAPETMTASLFSTHPSSPERSVRAEKVVQELISQGIQPNLFQRPRGGVSPALPQPGVFQKTLALPTQIVSAPPSMLSQATAYSLSLVNPVRQPKQDSAGTSQSQRDESMEKSLQEEKQRQELRVVKGEQESLKEEGEILEKQKADYEREREELERQREAVRKLRQEEQKRLRAIADEARRHAAEQEEFERILLEAREASIRNRYEEFGILEMGLAKQVTNLWVGKKVTGQQRIFPLSQGRVDWYCQYRYWSTNTWKALGLMHRKYRAYWYSPDEKLFSEQDFTQSKYRAEFAKTTLKWDSALGDRLVGEWTLRIFEGGKLVDERTFELVR